MIDYTPKPKRPKYEKFASTPRPKDFKRINPVVNTTFIRDTEKIGSRVTPSGNATMKEAPKYTGDKVIGISILHKSCLQPVFSQTEAIENAQMRR